MSFFNFPSEFVYWDKVENHDEIKMEIMPKILEIAKKTKNNPFECCKFNTGFTRCENDNNDKNGFLMSVKIEDIIIKHLIKMRNKYNNQSNYFKINDGISMITNGWWNVYQEGDFQEEHVHLGEPIYNENMFFYPSFSIIYILHDENEESSIIFKKPAPVTLMKPFQPVEFSTSVDKTIGEGTILIFPCNLSHLVKPCIKPGRVTLAYNVYSTFE